MRRRRTGFGGTLCVCARVILRSSRGVRGAWSSAAAKVGRHASIAIPCAVAVFQHGGRFLAIDANCYHAAGRLEEHGGDIEDVNGEPCIRCPMHKYIISLSSGHSFYEAVEVIRQPGGPPSFRSLGFKSKGVKQRCHHARVEGNRLLIRITRDGEVESDRYAYV
ncbi:hypothetical protein, conserved [Babesia bigemina]|uniref:Rieske domain-containing protein n=1 Tax=Babesia bigemina TaxID=5866 RepID=A0A061DAI7_BABBI|nr:hypothetical protein, conserved [Babesia bigemina]CDR95909.1 hypothetical protein, conserved [Babesia bigemina]|eukprot:XP_012768095.1 hypothetical protein, conserved [Babesia bigemina]